MSKKQEAELLYSDDLIIPIYIDTNALLDLLASVERGFSIVEKITMRNTQSRNSEQNFGVNGGTDFGIPNLFNVIKIALNGSANWKQGGENGEERASERYHTYGSLLQRLRTTLIENGLVREFDGSAESWDTIEPHDFIEIRGKFQLNPLTESFGTIERMLGFMELFAQMQNPSSKSKGSKPTLVSTQPVTPNPFDKITITQMKQIHDFIKGMLDQLEKKDIRTTVIHLSNSSTHKAVAYIFTEYLRDVSMTELQYKEYKLLGKVVDKLTNANDGVDLLQGTALSGFDEATISNLVGGLNQPANGINLPKIETKIKAPVLQLIPIAIYV